MTARGAKDLVLRVQEVQEVTVFREGSIVCSVSIARSALLHFSSFRKAIAKKERNRENLLQRTVPKRRLTSTSERKHKQTIHQRMMRSEEAAKKAHYSRQTQKTFSVPWATTHSSRDSEEGQS